MSNPIPGKTYTTKAGDTLRKISARAYGTDEKWPLIFSAFEKKTLTDTQDEVFPGETITIPLDAELRLIRDNL
jgi:nucleoid-associated protein YgaU